MFTVNLKGITSGLEAVAKTYPHTIVEAALEAVIMDGEERHVDSIADRKALYRSDGKFLEIVGDGYHVEQPIAWAEDIQPWLDTGKIELISGFTFDHGRRAGIQAKIKGGDTDILPGDGVSSYLTLATGFDGSLPSHISVGGLRAFCANVLKMIFQGKQQSIIYKNKHTRNFTDRKKLALEGISKALNMQNGFVEQLKQLAHTPATQEKLEGYIRTLWLGTPEKKAFEEASTKSQNTIRTVIELLDTQKGLELVPAARGTMWQGYNAVTQYLTHDYGRNEDSRTESLLFGENSKFNSLALEIALSH